MFPETLVPIRNFNPPVMCKFQKATKLKNRSKNRVSKNVSV